MVIAEGPPVLVATAVDSRSAVISVVLVIDMHAERSYSCTRNVSLQLREDLALVGCCKARSPLTASTVGGLRWTDSLLSRVIESQR